VIWFIHLWIIVMDGDEDSLVVAGDDNVTGIARTPRIPEKKILWIGIFVWVFLNHFSSKNDLLNVGQGSTP
jgi:hypothetical protein